MRLVILVLTSRPTVMTPTRRRRQLRDHIQRLLRAAALTLALHGRTAAAQLDTHVHAVRSGEGDPRLGTITFPTSGNARAQTAFVRGIAYLHSFHYDEAAKAFQAAERADRAFALPYWFEAFTHSHLMWNEEDVPAGRKVLARLNATATARLARAATPREREFGAAFEAFFADTTPEVRTRAFADSMRSMTARYPKDLEAAAFASLAIMQAIDQQAFPADSMSVRAKQMVDLAERVFKASPNHPGAAHYLIHVSDLDPSFSTRALPAARAYARIAPDASHALHMPSHVFLRLGLWDDAASSNEHSWAASRREMVRDSLTGADLDSHSLEFLAYAYLEAGRWRAARAIIDTARRVIGKEDLSDHFETRYAIPSLTFVNAAETGRWRDVVLPPPSAAPPRSQREAITMMIADYQRHVIEAMRGDTAALAAGAADFRARSDAAHAAVPGLEFGAAELEALLARARGDRPRAVERLAHAGEIEDQLPIAGPPRFVSARELLGLEYLKAGRADSAAVQFERVLVNQPKRSIALLGLARARVALGERDAAVNAYSQLLANWHRADADLPALAEVRAGATGKPSTALGTGDGLADDVRFAIIPLPEQMRAGATVMRLDSTHHPVVVRQGSNGMVCMRFVPGEAAWDARCYDGAMFRVMMRVRELFAAAVSPDSLDPRLKAEVRAGTLTLPNHPTAGYRVLGGPDSYNPATGAITDRMERWQSVHAPFATAKELGFLEETTVSDAQRARTPYVMASGTWWAHVMIEHGPATHGGGPPTATQSADGKLADDIRFALLPLPEQLRADATVMRIDSTAHIALARRGSNGLVCMRFVPGEGAWDARCYEETMFQVVARMRELYRSGVAPGAIGPRIDAEMQAGTLKTPTHPAVGYRALGGPGTYNPATGVATERLDVWQSIHVPFATANQLGFPDESTVSKAQEREGPFVMASGTGWAHVMINHPMPPASTTH